MRKTELACLKLEEDFANENYIRWYTLSRLTALGKMMVAALSAQRQVGGDGGILFESRNLYTAANWGNQLKL
jgi:hypothetical protein